MAWNTAAVAATAALNGKPAWDLQGTGMHTGSGANDVGNQQLNRDATIFIVSMNFGHGSGANQMKDWGSQFHHGGRDSDFIVELSGGSQYSLSSGQPYDGTRMNLQTSNDNNNVLIAFEPSTPELWSGRITTAGKRTFWRTTRNSDGTATRDEVEYTGSNGISAGLSAIYVGKSERNEAFNGYMSELVYYNSALTDAQMEQMTSLLFGKWLA